MRKGSGGCLCVHRIAGTGLVTWGKRWVGRKCRRFRGEGGAGAASCAGRASRLREITGGKEGRGLRGECRCAHGAQGREGAWNPRCVPGGGGEPGKDARVSVSAPAVRARAIPTGVRGEPPSGDPTREHPCPLPAPVRGACLPLYTHAQWQREGKREREKKGGGVERGEIERRIKRGKGNFKRKRDGKTEKDPRIKPQFLIAADIIHTLSIHSSLV